MRKSEINSNLVIGFDVEKNVYEFSLRRNERVVVVFSVNRADFSGDEVYDGIGRAVVAFFDMLHEKDVFVRTEKSLLTLDEIKLIVGRLTFESDLSEIRAVNDIICELANSGDASAVSYMRNEWIEIKRNLILRGNG